MNVPFLDLTAQYSSIQKEIDPAIQKVINDTAFIGNEGNQYVKSFEANFANFVGTKYCVGCANGTDAIELALEALGIGDGDEVIVPANTWISTSEAVSTIGATPVFVDILPDLFTIDTDKIKEKISNNTKAIIPVHLYGLPANMHEILRIAKEYNLKIIEDCAQAHGATINGQKVGTFGNAATFSFFPGKNLGAYGDAGAVCSNSSDVTEKVRMLRNHGQLVKHQHTTEGRNSRLDGIQASILDVKLKYLNDWNNARNKAAALYKKHFSSSDVGLPICPENYFHVYHLYVIKVDKREELIKHLHLNHIQTAIHYPTPLPFLKAYKKYNYNQSDLENAYFNKDRILSLPMFPEIKEEQIEYVVSKIESFLG